MKKYIVHVEDKKESRPRPHETEAVEKIAQIVKSDLVFFRELRNLSRKNGPELKD